MHPHRSPEILVGSCFGIGLSPVAPGTVASAAFIPLAYGTWLWLGAIGLWLLLVASVGACVWAADAYEQAYGKDPSSFVMDEWAGQAIPFALLSIVTDPFAPIVVITSFGLFRLFDIWKPGPIGTIQNRPGVIGLAGDDVLAGLFASGTGFLVILTYYRYFGG